MAQTGCPHWFSNLVAPLPTQNRPLGWFVWAKGYFSLFWPLFGTHREHLGLSGSGKWAKLLSLELWSAVPFSYQPIPLNMGSHMAIIMNMPIFALFFIPFGGLNMRNAWSSSCNGGQCTEWDQNKTLMTAMEHFWKRHTKYFTQKFIFGTIAYFSQLLVISGGHSWHQKNQNKYI